jgi:hypothetical protein
VVAAAVLLAATGVAPALAHHRPGPCDFHRREGETIRHLSKRRIVCAVNGFGPVRGGAERAVCIARRESGLDPSATSEPTGEYRGLYQHDRDFWPGRFEEHTKRWWDLSPKALNGRSNAIVTIRMVVAYGGWRAAGWPPKEC